MTSSRVGFIGLGLMGGPMVERLLDHGIPLAVWNRTAVKSAPFEAQGAVVAQTPREVAAGADLLLLMLADGFATSEVWSGPQGLAAGLLPDTIVVNLATVGPNAARTLARQVEAAGARYLDCPVLGSIGPARKGELLLFAAGDPAVIDAARPVLDLLAKRLFLCGEVGRASALKLVMNLLLARYVEALGEVMSLSAAFEVDPVLALEAMQASVLASPMWEKGKVLLEGDPPLHFPLRLMTKDLRLLDEEIDRSGLSLPVHEAVYGVFQEAMQRGLGDRDYSEVATWILGRK